jgi:hypothetical protein
MFLFKTIDINFADRPGDGTRDSYLDYKSYHGFGFMLFAFEP